MKHLQSDYVVAINTEVVKAVNDLIVISSGFTCPDSIFINVLILKTLKGFLYSENWQQDGCTYLSFISCFDIVKCIILAQSKQK